MNTLQEIYPTINSEEAVRLACVNILENIHGSNKLIDKKIEKAYKDINGVDFYKFNDEEDGYMPLYFHGERGKTRPEIFKKAFQEISKNSELDLVENPRPDSKVSHGTLLYLRIDISSSGSVFDIPDKLLELMKSSAACLVVFDNFHISTMGLQVELITAAQKRILRDKGIGNTIICATGLLGHENQEEDFFSKPFYMGHAMNYQISDVN